MVTDWRLECHESPQSVLDQGRFGATRKAGCEMYYFHQLQASGQFIESFYCFSSFLVSLFFTNTCHTW